MNTEQKVTIALQEELVIPQHLATLAQLRNEETLEVIIEKGKIIIAERPSVRHLVDGFIAETKQELANLNPDEMWNSEMTVKKYLALSEEARDRLWEAAFAQAHAETENAKELNADANYIPSGQRDC